MIYTILSVFAFLVLCIGLEFIFDILFAVK